MTSDEAALRSELKEVEDLIAQARSGATGVHQELGGRDDGPLDAEETAVLFTTAQEQEAVRDELKLRRDKLRRRLGMDPAEPEGRSFL
jgi:hypothetical protein